MGTFSPMTSTPWPTLLTPPRKLLRTVCGRSGPSKPLRSQETRLDLGGRYRIRTCVGVSRRIYSPLPLAARATCRLAGYNERVDKAQTAITGERDGSNG